VTIRIADPSSQDIFCPHPLPAAIPDPRKEQADAPTPLAAQARRERVYRLFLAILGPLALLLLWHFAVRWALLPVQILPAPEAVARSLVDLATSGRLASNLAISVRRVALGFLIGAGAGLLLGSAMGLSAKADRFLRPTFLVISQIPVLGWLPFLMLLLGIGEALKIVIIAKAAFTPVTLNTLNGFRAVPSHYLEVARIYRFSPWQLLGKVMLPAAFPPIFTGLRYGLTHSWLSLVAVELLASTEGVGYLMVWSRQLFQLDTMIAMMVVIGVIGYLMDRLLSAAEALVLRRYGGSVT
jgi:sulfonate transport system permease protein